jgi:hypothetical protein
MSENRCALWVGVVAFLGLAWALVAPLPFSGARGDPAAAATAGEELLNKDKDKDKAKDAKAKDKPALPAAVIDVKLPAAFDQALQKQIFLDGATLGAIAGLAAGIALGVLIARRP